MPWMTFGLALVISLVLVPIVRHYSIKYGRVARPREDRWHQKPTATLGGIAIFLGFIISLGISLIIKGDLGQVKWGLIIGSVLMFLLGLYDDLRRLSPQAKLAGQILTATVVIAMGFTTNFFTPRIANPILAQLPNILLTFVWLIGITNAINLLDNMDGLAGGISLVTALFLSYFFFKLDNLGLLFISLALSGSVLGFLFYNFPPASIFMGDSGSLFLGFTLAELAIARQPQASNVFAVVAVPTLLFLLPILDTTLVTFTRLLRGQSPAQGGRDHTSHRLIAFGLSERQAVLTLYGVAIISGVMAAALESIQYWYSLVFVPILLISLALLTAYLGGMKVVTTTSSNQARPLTRIMLELTLRRRLLEVILDFFLIGVVYYLSVLIWNGFNMNEKSLEFYLRSLPIILGGSYLAFFTFGVYRGVWRYVGIGDLMHFIQASIGAGLLASVGVTILVHDDSVSFGLFLLFAVFLFLGLAASRSSFKILDSLGRSQLRHKEERVLICGAGDTGEMTLRWILMNPQLEFRPVGFIDDDPFIAGRQIHGVPILGKFNQMGSILEQKQIDGVILSERILKDNVLKEDMVTICHQYGCWVRSLRLEFDLLE